MSIPPDITAITTWQEAEAALAVLRVTDAEMARAAADYDAQIAALQERRREACAPHVERRDRVGLLLEAFVTAHRDEVVDGKGRPAKSRKLAHGVVGWKASAARVVFVNSEEHTRRMLRVRGLLDCLVTEEKVQKTKLKELPPSELSQVGCRLEQDESFYYKLNDDPVAR